MREYEIKANALTHHHYRPGGEGDGGRQQGAKGDGDAGRLVGEAEAAAHQEDREGERGSSSVRSLHRQPPTLVALSSRRQHLLGGDTPTPGREARVG